MISDKELRESLDKYSESRKAFMLQADFENEKAFRFLISIREKIPKGLYGRILNILYTSDTDGVSMDTLLEAFQNTSRTDLMHDEDIEKLNKMSNEIVIFRGTQDYHESTPRLSWSLSYDTARIYGNAHIFKAKITKDKVIAYFAKEGDEEEIVAHITDGYEIMK